MNINVFLFFPVLSFLQIEREREYTKFGIRRNSPKVTYLIFRRGSTGESFFFHGLIDFMLFLTLAWRTWVPRVQDMFLSSSPGVNGYGSVCHEPLPITNISSRFFRWRGEGCHFRFRAPANHLASLPFLPPGQAILLGLPDVTQVRLLLIQTAVIPLPSSQWDITWHVQLFWI